MKQWVYIPKSGEEYRKAVLLASQAGLTIIDSSSCDEISAEVLFRMMPIGVIVFERTSRKIDGYREIGFEDFILMLDDGRDHIAEIDYTPLEEHEAKTELQCSTKKVAFSQDDHDALTFHAIEKDPNGIDQHSAGAKLDHGKCLAGVLLDFGRALERVADVGTFGANKYTRGGWQSVQNGEQRYEDALMRHLLAAKRGDGTDDQTGMSHLHHAAWNILAIIELKERANASSYD